MSPRWLIAVACAWVVMCSFGHVWSQDCCPGTIKTKTRTVIHCGRCKKQAPQCCCPQPMLQQMPIIQSVPQTTYEPVYETRYRTERVVNNRPVVETHSRAETFTQNVPMTTYRTVTVDEGEYKQIWVPKMVTKQVPQTVMTQQVGCRMVPYQVTKMLPEVTTKMVPFQTVRYVARTTCTTACVPGMTTTMLPMSAISSTAPIATPTYATAMYPASPAINSYPTGPSFSTAMATPSRYDANPAPVPNYSDSPVGISSNLEYEYQPAQAVPGRGTQATIPTTPAPRSSNAAGRFSAPSAAAVWRATAVH